MKQQAAGVSEVMSVADLSLKVLTLSQIRQIDDILSKLGPFGELRLIKKKGHLRFIEKVESFDLSEET